MKTKKKFLLKKIKKKPKFSVITVVKNDQHNISNTIKSINNQSYKDFEYLIIDGKSTDETLTKILEFKNKINILISENDKGIYHAMNKAIKLTKGKIIIFVNSGDLLTKNALKDVNRVFQKNKNFDFVFGTVKRHYTSSSILKYGVNKKKLLYNFDFATSHSAGFFLKSRVLWKHGLLNTRFKHSADYDLYYRLIIRKKIIGGSTSKSKIIGIVSKGGYSSKVSFINHLIEECNIRVYNKQNFFFVVLIFINAIFKFLLKRIGLLN